MPENLSQERLDYVKSRMIAIDVEKELLIRESDALEEYLILEKLSTSTENLSKQKPKRPSVTEEGDPATMTDSVWETLRKISGMGDTVKIMCSDRSIDPQQLMLAGFRGAVRLAKQALKDAGK